MPAEESDCTALAGAGWPRGSIIPEDFSCPWRPAGAAVEPCPPASQARAFSHSRLPPAGPLLHGRVAAQPGLAVHKSARASATILQILCPLRNMIPPGPAGPPGGRDGGGARGSLRRSLSLPAFVSDWRSLDAHLRNRLQAGRRRSWIFNPQFGRMVLTLGASFGKNDPHHGLSSHRTRGGRSDSGPVDGAPVAAGVPRQRSGRLCRDVWGPRGRALSRQRRAGAVGPGPVLASHGVSRRTLAAPALRRVGGGAQGDRRVPGVDRLRRARGLAGMRARLDAGAPLVG